MCTSIRHLFEFARRALSVLLRLCESCGLVWSSLHKWTLPLLNRAINLLYYGGAAIRTSLSHFYAARAAVSRKPVVQTPDQPR